MSPTPEQVEYAAEAAARSMDRMMATLHSEWDRIVLDFDIADTEAVLVELDTGAPCGICGQERCRERDRGGDE